MVVGKMKRGKEEHQFLQPKKTSKADKPMALPAASSR
jgi:hypothetical protein